MAWDRRLLSRHQHLTLLISGARGIYPFIDNMGRLVPAAVSLSANISFKVGITRKYKPSREQAMEAGRTFGLIVDDAEDEFQKQAERAAAEAAALAEWEDDPYFEDNIDQLKDAQEEEVDEEEENGKIDKFSLSSSLESLLDQAFLKVVQLRREFGLGWAGAEVLYFEMEKSQVRPEEIMRASGHVSLFCRRLYAGYLHAFCRKSISLIKRRTNSRKRTVFLMTLSLVCLRTAKSTFHSRPSATSSVV